MCLAYAYLSEGVVKLYELFSDNLTGKGSVYNTLKLCLSKLPQCVMREGTLYSLSVKYQKAFLALVTQLTDELIFI